MKTTRIVVMLLVSLTFSHGTAALGQQHQTSSEELHKPAVVAFVNVNVVPMDRERILPGQTVIVREDRISEFGPADMIDIPEGALRIDGRDKYLMPGLVDMHVHQRGEHRKFQLTLFIANGVTTVRNMAGDESVLRFREQIEAGRLVGPAIYTTGPITDGNPPIWPGSTVVETPEQAAQAVAEHKEAGYSFIKVYNRLSLECYDATVEAAARHGLPVVGHVPNAVGLEHALAANQYSVEHLSGYGDFLQVEDSTSWDKVDKAKISAIARTTREAGTWNCVTLVLFQKAYGMTSEEAEQERKLPYMKYISPHVKMRWTEMRWFGGPGHSSRMSNRRRMTKALHDAGARILLGTDTPNPYVAAGFSLHQELQNLVDAGLTPYEAIKAGTHDAAECLGELDEFGTIRTGLRADLVLTEDNPLKDVGNAARRIGVMVRGRWFPQFELQAMLDALAIKHAAEENPEGVMLRERWYSRSELEAMADWCKEMVDVKNESQRQELLEAVLSSGRVFLAGDKLVTNLIAGNLTQVGLQAHVAGNATAPAIAGGDMLLVLSHSRQSPVPYDLVSAAKTAVASVVLLTDRIPSAATRNVCDLVFVLGSDFDDAARLFTNELLTATTVSLRRGGPAGKMTYDGSDETYTVHGAGRDIWGASDQFHFAHHRLRGNGSIAVRIDSIEPLHNWAKAGLMIRDTTASDSAYIAVFITPQHLVTLQYRSEAGRRTFGFDSDRDAITLPHWIKLIRKGKTFEAQHSEDGRKWKDLLGGSSIIKDTLPAVVEVKMDDPLHVGPAVCSHSGPAITAEAKMSQVLFGGAWSPSGRFTHSEDIGYEAWGE